MVIVYIARNIVHKIKKSQWSRCCRRTWIYVFTHVLSYCDDSIYYVGINTIDYKAGKIFLRRFDTSAANVLACFASWHSQYCSKLQMCVLKSFSFAVAKARHIALFFSETNHLHFEILIWHLSAHDPHLISSLCFDRFVFYNKNKKSNHVVRRPHRHRRSSTHSVILWLWNMWGTFSATADY